MVLLAVGQDRPQFECKVVANSCVHLCTWGTAGWTSLVQTSLLLLVHFFLHQRGYLSSRLHVSMHVLSLNSKIIFLPPPRKFLRNYQWTHWISRKSAYVSFLPIRPINKQEWRCFWKTQYLNAHQSDFVVSLAPLLSGHLASRTPGLVSEGHWLFAQPRFFLPPVPIGSFTKPQWRPLHSVCAPPPGEPQWGRKGLLCALEQPVPGWDVRSGSESPLWLLAYMYSGQLRQQTLLLQRWERHIHDPRRGFRFKEPEFFSKAPLPQGCLQYRYS